MKRFLKVLTFTLIALLVTDTIAKGFSFGESFIRTLLLLCIALTVFNLFLKKLLKILSMPTEGIGFIFLNTLLTFVIFYVLTIFVLDFRFIPSITPNLLLLGIVIPSKALTALSAGVVSAVIFSLSYIYLEWISD